MLDGIHMAGHACVAIYFKSTRMKLGLRWATIFILLLFLVSNSKFVIYLCQYLLAANRPKVIAEKPDLTFGEVGKELGARWRALSDAKKAEWKAKPE